MSERANAKIDAYGEGVVHGWDAAVLAINIKLHSVGLSIDLPDDDSIAGWRERKGKARESSGQ
jgi:hypothetical protein